jgi:hypothetical protein
VHNHSARFDCLAVLAARKTLNHRKQLMNHIPATVGFSGNPNVAGLEMKAAMLQFAQQIFQYELDYIQTELADDETETQRQKPPRDMAQSQKLPINLPGGPYFKLINYWTGLTQVMFQGSVQMSAAMHKCGVGALEQLREQTSRVTPAIPGITPAIPNYMLSAMEVGMGYAMATLDESQHFAVDNANAVLDATEEHATDGAGKHSKSGARAKHNGRHASDGTAA